MKPRETSLTFDPTVIVTILLQKDAMTTAILMKESVVYSFWGLARVGGTQVDMALEKQLRILQTAERERLWV